jgi:tetratricopeptide (TPR) repeat protein
MLFYVYIKTVRRAAMHRSLLVLILLLAAGGSLFGQSAIDYSLEASPYATLPLGSSSSLFKTGFGSEVLFSYLPPSLKGLALDSSLNVLSLPLASADSIWTIAGSAGPGYRLPMGERLSIHAGLRGGYYYWGAAGWEPQVSNIGGFLLSGNAGALFRVSGTFTAGVNAAYDYYNNLYNGLRIGINMRLDFPGLDQQKSSIEIDTIRLLPLFPVLYRYYDTHSVGSVRIKNSGSRAVQGISLALYVDRYMDNPMESGIPITLAPGEEREIPLYGLFNDKMMDVTEGTKVSARVTLSHPLGRRDFSRDYTGSLEFYNRNAMSWDDDRKIASFITAKDPDIMNFAKNMMSWMQEVRNPALDENFQKGMAIFEAVRAYGIRYEIDPVTPFSQFSEAATSIDFLQFPRQTLQYSNGDCDDLTSLYCALLESVGVETAFITVPGHIYAAFALSTGAEEAAKTFSKTRDLIIIDGKAWLPVEITLSQSPFEKAWETGARQWREAHSAEQAALFATREAWQTYQPVGFREGAGGLMLPNREQVISAIRDYTGRYVESELNPRLAELQDRMRRSRDKTPYLNRIAVLYARYGLYDKALETLMEIVKQKEHSPALTNLGNIHYLREEWERALGYYQRALAVQQNNSSALVGLARCSHKLENYGTVQKIYDQLKNTDPALAERFAYLNERGEEAERASGAVTGAWSILWEEEE